MKTIRGIRNVAVFTALLALLGGGMYMVNHLHDGPSSVVYVVRWTYQAPSQVVYTKPDGTVKILHTADLVADNPASAQEGGAWTTWVAYRKGETYTLTVAVTKTPTYAYINAGSNSSSTHSNRDGETIITHMLAIW